MRARTTQTYQVEVILDKIAFEGLEWQRSIPHRHDERVVNEPMPYGGDIWSFQHPLDEVASNSARSAMVEERVCASSHTKIQQHSR